MMTKLKSQYNEAWPDDLTNRPSHRTSPLPSRCPLNVALRLCADTKRVRQQLFERTFARRERFYVGDTIADYALFSWGNGRSGQLGTGSTKSRSVPAEVARSRHSMYVDVAAAPRHTLLASRDGIVYACGEGLKGQLGSKRVMDAADQGNGQRISQGDACERTIFRKESIDFCVHQAHPKKNDNLESGTGNAANHDAESKRHGTNANSTKRIVTSLSECLTAGGRQLAQYPTRTFPSGHLVRDGQCVADLYINQVTASLTASFAREVSHREAIAARSGLTDLVEQIRRMDLDPRLCGSESIAQLRASLVEECAELRRKFRGRVVAWGDGSRGQLGLGPQQYHRAAPLLIPTLSQPNLRVLKIAAGRHHVLAIAVTQFGADNGATLLYSWGCGRDGRLGHDDYLDRHVPTVVGHFTRDETARPRLIAAGDAHSIALVDAAPDSLIQPGLYSWGRGAHGRLGLGYQLNVRRPCRVSQWPLSFANSRVVDVALGGAHSLVLAEKLVPPGLVNPWGSRRRIYSWGFGSDGALGNEKLKHCSTPQQVKMPKWEVVTSIAAGRSHSLAITVHGELYAWGKGWCGELGMGDNIMRIAPCRVESKAQFLRVSAGDTHTVAVALRHRALDKRQVESGPVAALKAYGELPKQPIQTICKFGWRCVRSRPNKRKHAVWTGIQARCKTCNIRSVCSWCARICHAGHELDMIVAHTQKEVVAHATSSWLCDCGLSSTCRRMPYISEWLEDPRICECIERLQSFIRRCLAVRRLYFKKEALHRTKEQAVNAAWYGPSLLGAVWKIVRDFGERKLQRVERDMMSMADAESIASRRYLKLQLALQAVEAQKRMLRTLCSMTGAPDPHPSSTRLDLRFRSVRALRQWHRHHKRGSRLSHDQLRRWADKYNISPIDDRKTDLGLVHDPDVCLLVLQARAASIASVDPDAASQLIRRASVAAPENLYSRVRRLRLTQKRRLTALRRRSLEPGAREDKSYETLTAANQDTSNCHKKVLKHKRIQEPLSETRRTFLEPPPECALRHRRTKLAAAEDEREGELVRIYREGVASSLDQMQKVYPTEPDTAEGCEKSLVGRPICKALLRSRILPGQLFVAPCAHRSSLEANSSCRNRRSKSLAAPERLAATKCIWNKYESFVRGQRTCPTKCRIVQKVRQCGLVEVRERAFTFLNFDDGAGTTSSDSPVGDPRLSLTRGDWEEQSLLVESIAAKANRRSWLITTANLTERQNSDRAMNEVVSLAPATSSTSSGECTATSTSHPPMIQIADSEAALWDVQGNAWVTTNDDRGNRYYYCEKTGESSWYPPATSSSGLPH